MVSLLLPRTRSSSRPTLDLLDASPQALLSRVREHLDAWSSGFARSYSSLSALAHPSPAPPPGWARLTRPRAHGSRQPAAAINSIRPRLGGYVGWLEPGSTDRTIWGRVAAIVLSVAIVLAGLTVAARHWFIVDLGPLGENGEFPEGWQDTKNSAERL